MKRKRGRRYHSANEIIADIEEAQARKAWLEKEAERLEVEARATRFSESDMEQVQSGICHKDAMRIQRSIDRLERIRLPRLKRTLAAFETTPLIGTRDVVLQSER